MVDIPKQEYSVLLVDDEPGILTYISKIISEIGYKPILASSAKEAIEKTKEFHQDMIFILSDYRMPEIDGFQLRESLLKYKEIPFAILSGYVSREMALFGMEQKICAFLDKPVAKESIVKLIEKETKDRIEELEFAREIKIIFLQEAFDLIEEIEPLLLQLEDHSGDIDLVNAIYRLVHTIKGGANVLGDENFVKFLHAYEEIYTKIKNHDLMATHKVISVLLRGFDKISEVINSYAENNPKIYELDSLLLVLDLSDGDKPEPGKVKVGPQRTSSKDKLSVPMKLMDEFMGQSGEITVIRNMVNKLVNAISKDLPNNKNVQQLGDLLDEMHKINSSIQRKITEIRKVPMAHVFRPVPRIVRDICNNLGKRVKVVLEGEDMRVDTVISQVLNNCLVHMVRNSVDHGIEMPEDRQKIGKSPEGILKLVCQEDAENITVQIQDDGGGLNPEIIRNKVIEKKLMTFDEAQQVSDKKILNMIFDSGFSTASQVTDLSGRGVGMDMVRTSVEGLNGRIDIDSVVSQGTTFKLVMPIPKSVQIIDALIIRISMEVFAVPQDRIVRLITVNESRMQEMIMSAEGSELLLLDGNLVPLLDACAILGLEDTNLSLKDERNFIIVRSDNNDILALEVDDILDNESIVVKSIEQVVVNLKAFAGATFLGDGAIGLILDIEGCMDVANLQSKEAKDRTTANKQSSKGHLTSYVSFRLMNSSNYAISLKDTYRLERLERENLQYSGAQQILRYRSKIMPVFCLANIFSAENYKEPEGDLELVVIQKGDRFFGFEVVEIVDIFSVSGEIDLSVRDNLSYKGNVQINGKTHVILDPDRILLNLGVL